MSSLPKILGARLDAIRSYTSGEAANLRNVSSSSFDGAPHLDTAPWASTEIPKTLMYGNRTPTVAFSRPSC